MTKAQAEAVRAWAKDLLQQAERASIETHWALEGGPMAQHVTPETQVPEWLANPIRFSFEHPPRF